MLPAIAPRLGFILALSVVTNVLYELGHRVVLSTGFHTLIGAALALLATFRTNAAYDRFWEGRKAWGAIVNRTRNLVRQVLSTVDDREAARRIARLTIAFVHGSRRHLWGEKTTSEAYLLLAEDEAAALEAPPGVPQRALLAIGDELGRLVRRGAMDSIDRSRIEEDVTSLIDQFGICQRIQRTPIPPSYTLQLRIMLLAYCLTLPAALVEPHGWTNLLLVLLVSASLLGIEEIGVQLENPFQHSVNDIDLRAISVTIERDLRALVDLPAPDADGVPSTRR